MKVGFIGGGSWGSTLANLLSDNGHETLIYDINQETVKLINEKHTHPFFDCIINNDVVATTNLADVVNFSDIFLLPLKFGIFPQLYKATLNRHHRYKRIRGY